MIQAVERLLGANVREAKKITREVSGTWDTEEYEKAHESIADRVAVDVGDRLFLWTD